LYFVFFAKKENKEHEIATEYTEGDTVKPASQTPARIHLHNKMPFQERPTINYKPGIMT
jgi:hypothetical protein